MINGVVAMPSLKPFRIVLLAAAFLLIGGSAFAQISLYLDVAGIQGDSTSASHPKTISATSFSLSCTNSGGAIKFQDLSVAKSLDRSSPLLFAEAAMGTNITSVTLYSQKMVNSAPVDYYVIKLTNAKVSSVSQSGNLDGPPSEFITFQYQRIEIDYTIFNSTGQPSGTSVMTWDTTTGKPF